MNFILPLVKCAPLSIGGVAILTTEYQSDMIGIWFSHAKFLDYFKVNCDIETMESRIIMIHPKVIAKLDIFVAVTIQVEDGELRVYPIKDTPILNRFNTFH